MEIATEERRNGTSFTYPLYADHADMVNDLGESEVHRHAQRQVKTDARNSDAVRAADDSTMVWDWANTNPAFADRCEKARVHYREHNDLSLMKAVIKAARPLFKAEMAVETEEPVEPDDELDSLDTKDADDTE